MRWARPIDPEASPAWVVALVPPRAGEPVRGLFALEAGAASIRNFEPIVVPGLLPTEDYARENFRNGSIELDSDEVERLLEVGLARQKDPGPRGPAAAVGSL